MFGFGPMESIVVAGLFLAVLATVIGGMAGIFYLVSTGEAHPEQDPR